MSSWRFRPTERAAGEARRAASECLRSWRLDSVVEPVELLASELITNACKATGSRADAVAMRLSATPGTLILEVWDANETAPRRQAAALEAEGGRGLLLVETLASRWHFYRPRSGGKVVWCSLPLPEATSRDDAEPLPQRPASLEPSEAIGHFDDVAVLQRVADGLRALDWDLPLAAHHRGRRDRTAALAGNERLPEDGSDRDTTPEGAPCQRTRP
jgi:anti-sigma regulatory factor (Ser/Thr protein kinase)